MIDGIWSEGAVFERMAKSGLVWEWIDEKETVLRSWGRVLFKEQKEGLRDWRMVNERETWYNLGSQGLDQRAWILFSVQWEPDKKVEGFKQGNDMIWSAFLKRLL